MDTLNTSRETPAVALEPNVWEETYQIRAYEVDWCNRLSILSMFNFMQDGRELARARSVWRPI